MGNPKGFLTIHRKEAGNRPVDERKLDFTEVEQTLDTEDRVLQASRCMECGVPFCHWACPLGNVMPEWQDLVYKGNWKAAAEVLQRTNNFPEFTGRICPALCEKSCVLSLSNEPVTIRENEAAVIERAFAEGFIKPNPPKFRTGKKVAVIGSGPSGLACADQLNKAGHTVTLFEKSDAVGGLLRYGIPDFKLNKYIIDRRLDILKAEGLEIKTNVFVGRDIKAQELLDSYDAVCLAIGAMEPRDLQVEGREIEGVHFALDFLCQQNAILRGVHIPEENLISAKNKNVLVIGGGDTGSDCIGTSTRQGAKSLTQIEIMPKPPVSRTVDNPWPYYPFILKTSSSHEEGCTRKWSMNTKRFIAENGKLSGVEVVEVEWTKDPQTGRMGMIEVPGSNKVIKAELALLAMGFLHPVHLGLADELGLVYDRRGNISVSDKHQTSVEKVFAAGDAASGASLVVRAMASGRETAKYVDEYLKK